MFKKGTEDKNIIEVNEIRTGDIDALVELKKDIISYSFNIRH